MKNKIISIFFCCVIIGPAIYFLPISNMLQQKEPVCIAIIGPMEEANGKAMRQGVELYREQINKQGGIDGRKIKFLFQDDQNNADRAERIALELAEENKVYLVLGHYYSSASLAAGKIYKKGGIPAISASVGAESIISDNEWYFRTIPGGSIEAKLVASYMYDILASYRDIPLAEIIKETIPASIIFTGDADGQYLLKNFEQIAQRFGIAIKGKWQWDDEKSASEQIDNIKKELDAIDDPGVIYFATHAAEGIQIVTALKDAGKTYPMIASAALTRSFFDKVKSYTKERETPGYYSDGMYFITPFMTALGGAKGFDFTRQFVAKYNKEPGVVAACYYDAVHVAVQAMKKSGLQAKKHIREDRRNIRTALAGMYNEEQGVKGITGLIWFDTTGGVRREYVVGRWRGRKAQPFFVQYNQHVGNVDDVLQGYLNGNVEMLAGLTMSSTHIVYVQVEDLEITGINKEKTEFGATFRLCFRYPARFDDASKESIALPIEFINALTPIKLGKPVQETTEKGVTSKVFQVQGRFRADSDADDSLFFKRDKKLFIHFRHATEQYDSLVYVPETVDEQNKWLSAESRTGGVHCYSDVLSKKTTLGNPKYFNSDYTLDYSRFNVEFF